MHVDKGVASQLIRPLEFLIENDKLFLQFRVVSNTGASCFSEIGQVTILKQKLHQVLGDLSKHVEIIDTY